MLRSPQARLLVLALALSAPACGGDDDDTEADADADADADSDADADADADGDGDACVADPAEVDLVGVWGVQASVQARLTERDESIVHLCPDGTALASATIYLRLEITSQADGRLEQTTSVCDLQLPSAPGAVAPCDEDPEPVTIAIGMGEELGAFLPTLEFPAEAALTVEDGCVQYQPDDLVLILGTNFEAGDRDSDLPFWDPACSDSTEECVAAIDAVADQDGDGLPGVTLTADSEALSGEAYVTFRTVPRLTGTVRDADTMVGTVAPELEYALVGSDIQLGSLELDTPTVIENLPVVEPLEEGSSFLALRADDWGDGSCAEILDHRADFDR